MAAQPATALTEGQGLTAMAHPMSTAQSARRAASALVRSRHLGLNFEAPFAVGEPLPDGPLADVTVRIGPSRPVPDDAPGPVVAQLKPPNSAGYTVYSVEDGYVFRFPGLCEFEMSGDGRIVACLPGPACTDDIVQVLMAGTLTAWVLTLRGLAVLHASAVRRNDVTVLVVGHSGRGKSTVAALFCAAGAELVADDVVALENHPHGLVCAGLGSELRLRQQASSIADLFPPPLPERRLTADGRLAIKPTRTSDEHNVVSAVLLPCPVRDGSEVATRRLRPTQATLSLLANARIAGMVAPAMQKAYFETVSALAGVVPVLEARVPWGPPFHIETARELLALTAAAGAGPEGA